MWFEPVNALDLIVKGLLIGVVASAPMGPVGVLCVQRTLNKGRWYGFVTGIGSRLQRHHLCLGHRLRHEPSWWISSKTKNKHGIKIINQVIGAVVMICSVVMLLGTVTNLYRFF